MTNRNPGIELFRVFCMLAICMQHAVVFSGTGAAGWESRFWNIGVVGFAFITGYYGTSFKLKKLVHLWLAAVWCVGAVAMVSYFCRGTCISIEGFKYLLFSNWYLNAYTVLLLLSPLLNAAVEKLLSPGEDGARRTAIVAFSILLVWSWFQELWGVRDYVPHMPGMGMKSFMALMYIYLIGRWVKATEALAFSKLKIWSAAGACLLLIPLCGSNISPVTILLTVFLFRQFQRIPVPAQAGKAIAFVIPSLFAVYLLHTNEVGFSVIADLTKRMISSGVPRYGAYLACAVSCFMVCLLLDVPRRIIAACLKKADGLFTRDGCEKWYNAT